MGCVEVNVANHIADVRLNRPDKYNALNPEMFKAIAKAGADIEVRDDVRVVVLSGSGPGFCSGLDFQSFQSMVEKSSSDLVSPESRKTQNPNTAQIVSYVWKKLSVPTIAAVHGVAYGGGFQIAMGADIRIVAPNVKLSVMEIKWGLIPDMCFSQTMRDHVRLDVAKELMFTGRVVGAEEALKLGLATRIEEDAYAAAYSMAEEIAGKSPDAIKYGKRLLEETWHDTSSAGLSLEAQLQLDLIGSSNQVEAVMSNFEKRPAKFNK